MNGFDVRFIASEDSFYTTIEPLLKLKLGRLVQFDIETTGLDCFSDDIILIQFSFDNIVYIYDVRTLSKNHIIYILSLLENKLIIGHNVKFDMKFIFEKYGIIFKNVFDTMLAETIINAGTGAISTKTHRATHKAFYSYRELLNKYLNINVDKSIRDDFIGKPDIIVTPNILDYCIRDVTYLKPLYEAQQNKITKRKLIPTINLEMKLLPVTVEMEHEGVMLDINKWGDLSKIAEQHASELKIKIDSVVISEIKSRMQKKNFSNAKELLDYYYVVYKNTKKNIVFLESIQNPDDILVEFQKNFNPNSNKQMLRLLHKLGIQSATTSSKELEKNFKDIDFVKLLVEYREWIKKITGFGKNFINKINPKTGKLHSEFHQGGTATGRYASFGPDLQNIPKDSDYRSCFIAPDGWNMLSGDYTQIELVLAAEISQDPVMTEAIKNNISLHSITASSIHNGILKEDLTIEQYTKGKSMNFAMLYGSSPRGIAYNFGVPEDEAQEYIENFSNTYPVLIAFMKAVHQKILEQGYSPTMLGRKRWFIVPNRWEKKDWKYIYQIYREGFNHIIQGTSADITKLAMCNVYYDNPFSNLLKIIMTVHDEIIFLARKDISKDAEDFVKNQMILAAKTFIKTLPVDVKVTAASCWNKED